MEHLVSASEELIRLWKEGDLGGFWKKGQLKCDKELGSAEEVDESFLRCNPNFLQCYFNNYRKIYPTRRAPFEVKSNNEIVQIFVQKNKKDDRFYSVITKDNSNNAKMSNYSVAITLYVNSTEKNKLTLFLEDSCHDTYLLPRKYAMGPMPNEKAQVKESLVWDNLGRDIYIDKYLVSNRDIIEWLHFSSKRFEREKRISLAGREKLAEVATNLTLDQMKAYCQFRGKHLLESHVFDAATFLPRDEEDNNSNAKNIQRSSSPWNKRWSESFLAKIDETTLMTEENCRKAYTKECFKLGKLKNYATDSTSWSGIYSPVGGFLEAFRNSRTPEKNLKASSFYFYANSSWHKLGYRAFWDGIDFSDKNFSWEFIAEEFVEPGPEIDAIGALMINNNYQIGFRCMRFISNEN